MICFILCAYGATQILAYSDLIPRPTSPAWLAKFAQCPMCVGFHVGWVLMLIPNSIFQFDVTVANGFVLGCISSGTSYFLSMVIGDDGIQIHQEMDTSAR